MRVSPGSMAMVTEIPIGAQTTTGSNAPANNASSASNGASGGSSSKSAALSGPASQTANDPRPVQELQQAAQRLRDATHNMVREGASPERNAAIRQIDKTLAEVEGAVTSLPTKLLLAGTKQNEAQKSADNLQRAADRLDRAAQALKSDLQTIRATRSGISRRHSRKFGASV